MDGQAPILTSDTLMVSDRLWNLSTNDDKDRKKGEWRKAIPPIGRRWTKMGPTDFFLRTMDTYLPDSIQVGVVHVAVDGCSTDLFHPLLNKNYIANIKEGWMRDEVNSYGGDPLQRLIDMARLAQQRGVIKGILYHQGETDAYTDKWCKNLSDIYNYLLAQLNLKADEVPLLVGETARKELGGVCGHANPTIDAISKFIPTAHVISSEGCEVSPDGAHFSHRGYELLGARYALEMLRLEGVKAEGSLQTETKAPQTEAPAFAVAVKVEHGKLIVSSKADIQEVSLVSWSGKTVAQVQGKGKRTVSINVKNLDEKRLFVVVKSTNGKQVRIQQNI